MLYLAALLYHTLIVVNVNSVSCFECTLHVVVSMSCVQVVAIMTLTLSLISHLHMEASTSRRQAP